MRVSFASVAAGIFLPLARSTRHQCGPSRQDAFLLGRHEAQRMLCSSFELSQILGHIGVAHLGFEFVGQHGVSTQTPSTCAPRGSGHFVVEETGCPSQGRVAVDCQATCFCGEFAKRFMGPSSGTSFFSSWKGFVQLVSLDCRRNRVCHIGVFTPIFLFRSSIIVLKVKSSLFHQVHWW